MVVLLAEGIHAGEQPQDGVVLPRAEVIEVQAVHQVELLAAVLMRLVAGGRDVVVPGRAVGVVVHALEDVALCVGHHPHVALVVGEEVAVGGRAGVAEADVATVEVVEHNNSVNDIHTLIQKEFFPQLHIVFDY